MQSFFFVALCAVLSCSVQCQDETEVNVNCQDILQNSLCGEDKVVCGSDGETYTNECSLEYHACIGDNTLFKVNDGKCEKHIGDIEILNTPAKCDKYGKGGACTKEYDPWCTKQLETYANMCELCQEMFRRQAQGWNGLFVIRHKGECTDDELSKVKVV